MQKIVVLAHLINDSLGILTQVLCQCDCTVCVITPFEQDWANRVRMADVLIIMGGPFSVNQLEAYPFLQHEMDLIKYRILEDKPTLGICLGAQLIAKAMGACVERLPFLVQRWLPLELTQEGKNSCLNSETSVLVFHSHQEVCQLPQGALLLCSTTQCPVQGFLLGSHTMGLQFHIEANQEKIDILMHHTGNHHLELSSSVRFAKNSLLSWLKSLNIFPVGINPSLD